MLALLALVLVTPALFSAGRARDVLSAKGARPWPVWQWFALAVPVLLLSGVVDPPGAVALPIVCYALHAALLRLGRQAKERTTLAELSMLREAVKLYRVDTGRNPTGPGDALAREKVLGRIPAAQTPPYHKDSTDTTLCSSTSDGPRPSNDSGGWGYIGSGPQAGAVFVNCTHTDSKGKRWDSY